MGGERQGVKDNLKNKNNSSTKMNLYFNDLLLLLWLNSWNRGKKYGRGGLGRRMRGEKENKKNSARESLNNIPDCLFWQ